MRFENHESKVEIGLIKDVMKSNIINGKPDQCIHATAYCIPECLQRHDPPKGWVEDVYEGVDVMLNELRFKIEDLRLCSIR